MDKICIRRLEVYAHHGVYEEEKRLGQKFYITVEMELDTRAAGISDDLQASVNYGEVCLGIVEWTKSHRRKLIEAAAEDIAHGIEVLDTLGVDTIIIGRGGGSIEDLWAFNEEIVAQAIFDCSVPIISAVGHETDTTIADFVADLRAPTPSAGAELAVYDYSLMQTQLDELALRYTRRMKQQIASARMRLSNDQIRLSHLSPAGQIREKRSYLVSLEEKLERQMQEKLRERRYQVSLYAEKLKGLSPLEKLSQGFSHVADAEGRTVTDVNRIQVGELVTIHVKNGRIVAQVKEKEEWKQPKKS